MQALWAELNGGRELAIPFDTPEYNIAYKFVTLDDDTKAQCREACASLSWCEMVVMTPTCCDFIDGQRTLFWMCRLGIVRPEDGSPCLPREQYYAAWKIGVPGCAA